MSAIRMIIGSIALTLAVPLPVAAQTSGRQTLAAETEDYHQHSASVIRITELTRQGDATVKLYGTAGGDPAMNGLYTYIAFYESSAEGWRVFRIGDVIDYRVVAEARGRVTLELRENVMNNRTGDIGTRTRRVGVSWPVASDGSPPAAVTVVPIR